MGRLATVFFAALVLPPVTASAQVCPADEEEEVTEDDAPPCPDVLHGARLLVADVRGGVTFRITTPERDNVATLRALVRHIAGVVEDHTHDRTTGDPPDPTMIPPVRMRVTNVDRGALVTARPDRPRNLALLRDQARQVEAFWAEWACVNDYMPPAGSIDI